MNIFLEKNKKSQWSTSVYHSFFQSHLAYTIQAWGQKLSTNSWIGKL